MINKWSKKLINYNQEFTNILFSLQKQEMMINQNEYKSQLLTNKLNEKIELLEEKESNCDKQFQFFLEQLTSNSPLVAERNQVKNIKNKVNSNKQKFLLHQTFIKKKQKSIERKSNCLSSKKKRIFYIINERLFNSNYSNETNTNEEQELSNKDKEMIDRIVNTYEKQLNNQVESISKETVLSEPSLHGKLSNLTIGNEDKNYRKKKQENFGNRKIECISHPNKSFYLLHNKKLIDSVTKLTEITKDDIGGEFSCNCLLKIYRNDIAYTEKVRAKSVSFKKYSLGKTLLSSSHKDSRIRQKHKQERIPTTLKNGRVIQKDIISIAVCR